MRNDRNRVSIDDIVKEIPFGKFQVYMIIIFVLIYSAPSIVVYNYSYFLIYPQYMCTVDGSAPP